MSGPSERPPARPSERPSENPRPPDGAQLPKSPTRRPWYLAAAMCLMWLMGVVGMMSGCEEVDYLRGSHELTDKLDRDADEAAHPIARTIVVRERAWVEAIGKHHQRAFPMAIIRTLVGVMLIIGAGGALVGRPGSRSLALQAIAASVIVVGATFFLLAPARYAAAAAVAHDAVENDVAVPQGGTRDAVLAEQHDIAMQREHSMALLELAFYGAAALALTRRRTKAYFAALSESVADAGS